MPVEEACAGEGDGDPAGAKVGADEAGGGPGEENESEESRPATSPHDLGARAKAEYERHMLMHMVRRRTRTQRPSPTRKGEKTREHLCVVMNFCALTLAIKPIMCLKCSHTGVVAAHVVRCEKVTPELVGLVAKDLNHMGHARVVVNNDNKPAMKTLAGRARDLRSHPTIIEEPPEYEPQ